MSTDNTVIVTQALSLLSQLHDLLSQALPPPAPGLPAGVVQVGPGTIVSVQPVLTPFGPNGAVTIRFVADTGQTDTYTFYKPTAPLALGSHVILSLLPHTIPNDYDVLYQVASADVAPVSGN